MLNHTTYLPDITYCGIDGRISEFAIKMLIRHAEFAARYFKFHKIVILTPPQNHIRHDLVQFISIDPIGSLQDYNNFCIKELHKHIDSKFCLLFQWDGCIANPHLWSNEFLDYDYIGAPWPLDGWLRGYPCRENGIVGNGGFSLRSFKLLQECSDLQIDKKINEDVTISLIYRQYFLSKGFKFPKLDIGKRFAIETAWDDHDKLETSFGFHSITHLKTFLRREAHAN